MNLRKKATAVFTAAGLLAGAALAAAPAAGAEEAPALGTNPLASVLLADGDTFDRNPYDFDIVTQAALAVLEDNPDSPVKVLLDGNTPVTAFIPNDRAFQLLVGDLTGQYYGFYKFDEAKVFGAVASLGLPVVETVLLYHVVPGATIDSKAALGANGAALTTAQGGTITVKVVNPWFKWIALQDNDPNDFDPFIVPSKFDINKGNKQIAHGIAFVLRPLDVEALLAG